MTNIFKFFNKKNESENSILNSGLKFAMEFGENCNQPIQKRLSKKYVFLSSQQLNEYNTICRDAMNYGENYFSKTLEILNQNNHTIEEKELKEKIAIYMLEKYSWIDKKNMSKLFSQSCYYALKVGLDHFIK